jgi:hypothetical protein
MQQVKQDASNKWILLCWCTICDSINVSSKLLKILVMQIQNQARLSNEEERMVMMDKAKH